MMKYVLVLFCIGLFLFSCNKNTETDNTEHSKVLNYLSSEKKYQNKKQYISFFNEKYDGYLNNKEYDHAAESLVSYGELVKSITATDSVAYKNMQQFINKKYPVKEDTISAKLYMLMGYNLQNKRKLDSTYIVLNKALDYSKKYPNSDVYMDAQNILANNYNYTNQFDKSIPIYLSLIPKAEKKNHHAFLGSLYNNIAYSYESFYAYKESEKFYKKSGEQFLLAKDTTNYLGLQSTFIINNFDKESDTTKSLKLIKETEKIYKQYKNRDEAAISNMNDAYMLKYFLKKQYDSALFYNQESANYYKKGGNDFFLSYYEGKEAELFFLKNGYLKDPQKVLTLASSFLKDQDFSTAKTLFNLLYKNAEKNKNFEEANKFRDVEITCNDKILKQNQDGKLFEFDKKYQSEKKEKEIATQKVKIQKNNFYIIALILALALSAAVVALYLNRLKRKKIIEEKNRSEQFIFDLLENVEVERNRIAYELHDSVNHSLLSVKNAILNKKEIDSESISNIIEEVREISRNLYPVILEKVGLEESIKSLSENFSNETKLFVTAEIYYHNKVEKSKELHLYRIIQEALNNTLKHGNATISKINMTTDESFLQLIIKDNGEGFDVNSKTKSKNSFGLQGIKQRVQALNGMIDLKSDDSGTTILIKMPI